MIIYEKLNQEFREAVEIREHQDFDNEDKITSETEETDANELCLSTKDATSIVGCSSFFHAGKRSEGKVSLPPCLLTIWYYRYALTLCIANPDLEYAWHSELNT